MSESVRSEGAKHALDSLDIMLSKLDNQSMYGWQMPQGESTPNPSINSLQKLPSYPAPYVTYPASSTASSRSLLSSYNESRCGSASCACKLAIGFIVLLLVIWGITIPLYFFVGPGKAELQRAADAQSVEVPETQKFAALPLNAEVGSAGHQNTAGNLENATVLNAVNCTVRIVNQLFSPELNDPSSSHYRTLSLKIETLLTIVFQKEKSFQKAIVTGYKLGTLVDFTVILNEERKDIQHHIHQVISDYLLNNWLMLGLFQIDISTLNVQYIIDPCKVHNGGCSHHCYWSVVRIHHICQCPQQYYLSSDQQTCKSVEPTKVSSEDTCSADQFHCHSNGNCIPDTWICDGVSDCLKDEDEDPQICEETSTNPFHDPDYPNEVYEMDDVRGSLEYASYKLSAAKTKKLNEDMSDTYDLSNNARISRDFGDDGDTNDLSLENFSVVKNVKIL